ncbi:MAG: protein-(glutamine-N5) methyltransferase, release factor-specific [Omnitrophica bacterium RIFCSPLOWO2_12_FULL_50_11]|nr:MAG: protein-(glutamine-N5) methyltransferase, release factor-specific [Omnitrophica bacterium RIFCSPLOWO2_12_FULL_50_11]
MPANGHKTIGQCLQEGVCFLKRRKVPEARISAEELLSFVLKRSRLSLYAESRVEVNSSLADEFERLLAKRATRYPLQYLLGTVPFQSVELDVGEGCPIPRPETELLVGRVLNSLGAVTSKLCALDIGTGSGNIAISLAKERPHWNIFATDISYDVLQYAKRNAVKNRVSDQIHFVATDLWNGLESIRFDAVVSNPPYLNTRELGSVEREVHFEPRLAFDGKGNGLFFYERIASRAREVLKTGGAIFFEVGSRQAKSVSAILGRCGFQKIETIHDDAKIERIVSAVC